MSRLGHRAFGRRATARSCSATLLIALVSFAHASDPVPAAGESRAAVFARLRQQAESLASRERRAEALRTFQLARRAAPTLEDEARMWFRIGAEASRLGKFAQALDAYTRQLALVDTDPQALANSAELLMALGRLDESIAAYREALAIEERAPDRRGHLASLSFGYLGLAAALDRSGRTEAAAEAVGHALALDPGLGVLRLAEQGGSDLFIIPAADASYYLALARMAQGRAGEALVALRTYLDAAAKGRGNEAVSLRYVERARAHLAALAKPAAPSVPAAPPAARGWRVVREATLRAEGPLVAPLIDAAWRLAPRLIDGCLAELPPPGDGGAQVRVGLTVTFDGSGRVRAVSAEPGAGASLPADVVSCIESALVARLRTPRPAHDKVTRAHLELVLAPVEPSGV